MESNILTNEQYQVKLKRYYAEKAKEDNSTCAQYIAQKKAKKEAKAQRKSEKEAEKKAQKKAEWLIGERKRKPRKQPVNPNFNDFTPPTPFIHIAIGKQLALTILCKLTEPEIEFFQQVVINFQEKFYDNNAIALQDIRLRICRMLPPSNSTLRAAKNLYSIISISRIASNSRIAIITDIKDAYIARNAYNHQLLDPITTPPKTSSID